MASPYPQHIILYGPPGVGKTSAARLALEEAKKVTDLHHLMEILSLLRLMELR